MENRYSDVVYMSETEVQSIISSFRSALVMYTTEIEKLQIKNEALQSDLHGETIKSTGLQEELKSLQLISQQKSSILDSYQEKINLIDAGLAKISTKNPTKSQIFDEKLQKLSESDQSDEKNKKELLETFNNLIESIKQLESKNLILKKNTEELQDDLERMNSDERVSKMCMHCKREFIPKQNKEGDCIYHSGKLKYYSCKGCGDDAYFNCCNRCLKCSEGCRRGKHIPL
jgi:chromosome segregation ATPase